MTNNNFPSDRYFSNNDAMEQVVKPGQELASGFATSEPHTFYSELWDFIKDRDITDIGIRQGLFMHPHKICLGDTLSAKGIGSGKIFEITQKIDGLKKLTGHYKECMQRNIRFSSGFIGGARNIIIPDNLITKLLFSEYAGRNTTRMGATDMHSVHFPDGVGAMAYNPDNTPKINTYISVITPPNEDGEISLGVANGANSDVIDKAIAQEDINLLFYVNPKYPFTRGYNDARNTYYVNDFKKLAEKGKLFVVEDNAKIPALPAGATDNPEPAEIAIAENLVNHIEDNKEFTYGRSIQVGIGGTGVQAIKLLKESGWKGRMYTEMLEPFTLDLFEMGKIEGTHFIEKNGTRTQLDGKMVCTFSICPEGDEFYNRINNRPEIIFAPASRVVVPEGFYGGMAINNILGVDFQGHVNSGGREKNHYSGIGGAGMINRGAANGGVAYLCLKSTHNTAEGKKRSSIFPFMPLGTPLSLTGPDLWGGRNNGRMFLVTEHGVALLSGKSQHKFIKQIISVAHPDFRGWLSKQAWKEFRVSV